MSDVALAGAAMAVLLFYWNAGKADRSNPFIALPIIWFGAAALAQVRLFSFATPWSPRTCLVVFAAPLVFSATGILFTGGGVARPADLPEERVSTGRLRAAAVVLLVAGALGLAWKSSLLGGLPLLSDQIDKLRSAGGIKVPYYITFMTDCFFVAAWLGSAAVIQRDGRRQRLDWLVLVLGLVGVSLSASRNTILLTLIIPLVVLYRLRRLRVRGVRDALQRIAVIGVVLLAVSGLFYYRTSQHKTSAFEEQFYSVTVANTPPAARLLLPVYIGLTVPFETLNRMVRSPPPPGNFGSYSLPGVPRQLWFLGPRYKLYDVTAALTRPYYFNVATFVAGFLAEGGLVGALFGTILLGAFFGVIWTAIGRARTWRALYLSAYVTYLGGFLLYEDLLGFYTLSVLWDMFLVYVLFTWAARGSVTSRRQSAPPSRSLAPPSARPTQ